jgi:hypothetical protein
MLYPEIDFVVIAVDKAGARDGSNMVIVPLSISIEVIFHFIYSGTIRKSTAVSPCIIKKDYLN